MSRQPEIVTADNRAPTFVPSDMENLLPRTHLCGHLTSPTAATAGAAISELEHVVLCGWVQHSRSIGEQLFQVLRDWSGLVQLRWSRDDAAASKSVQWEL